MFQMAYTVVVKKKRRFTNYHHPDNYHFTLFSFMLVPSLFVQMLCVFGVSLITLSEKVGKIKFKWSKYSSLDTMNQLKEISSLPYVATKKNGFKEEIIIYSLFCESFM